MSLNWSTAGQLLIGGLPILEPTQTSFQFTAFADPQLRIHSLEALQNTQWLGRGGYATGGNGQDLKRGCKRMLIEFESFSQPRLTCGCLFLKIVVHSLRRCSGFSKASLVVTLLFVPTAPAAAPAPLPAASELFADTCNRPLVPFEGCCVGMKPAELLCRRVLTTSRGHVTTAPTVPAVLNNKKGKPE